MSRPRYWLAGTLIAGCLALAANAAVVNQVVNTVAVGGITGLGTGVATALAVNTGSAGAPVLFNGAGGTPSSVTLTNATALPAGAMPALTGDCTTSAGAVATTCTKINAVDQTTAWTTFSSSATCGNNALTITSSKSKTIGKSIVWELDITLNATIGSCTSILGFNLPSTASTAGGGAGGEVAITGKGINCYVTAASQAAVCRLSDAANFSASAHIIASGVYESQ